MDPERWRRIESILDETLGLSPDEQAAFLDQACADEPELRNELESLLAAAGGSFLNTERREELLATTELGSEVSDQASACPKTRSLLGC